MKQTVPKNHLDVSEIKELKGGSKAVRKIRVSPPGSREAAQIHRHVDGSALQQADSECEHDFDFVDILGC